jgi:hypothetical protein
MGFSCRITSFAEAAIGCPKASHVKNIEEIVAITARGDFAKIALLANRQP